MYLNTVRFSLQLLICELFFFCALPRRKGFAWRAPLALAAYMAIGWCLQQVLDLIPNYGREAAGLLMTLHFFCVFLASMVVSSIVFKADRWAYVFAGVGGYATQHIAYSLSWTVRTLFFSGVNIPLICDYVFFRILPYFVTGALISIFLIRPSKWRGQTSKATPKKIVISGLILVSSLLLGSFVNIYGGDAVRLCRIYAAISCFLGLYIQFLYSSQEWLERENEEMEKLLHVSQSQSKMGTDAVEIINMKCHDLKHQLVDLENRLDEKENREVVKEISEAINIYDSQVKTGCDALDIVLMQKSLLCEGHQIPFDYIGDATKLNFMASLDIAALIGNALDNAIEREMAESADTRFINMTIKTMGEILLIHVANPCSQPLALKDGLPETTKEDKRYHGFGVRSMQYIVQKYGGELKFAQEDGIFTLDMMFTIPEIQANQEKGEQLA